MLWVEKHGGQPGATSIQYDSSLAQDLPTLVRQLRLLDGSGRGIGRSDRRDLRGRLDRQPHREPGPLAFLALDRDTAAMQIDHHLDEVKSHSGPDDARNITATVITLE